VQTKVEGILLSKIPYQDRHLIGKILLRSGDVISIIFYGGQGGGAKKKSSTIELGYMLKIELRTNTNKNRHLYHAREWQPLWYHKQIRLQHRAFYLLCLIIEMVGKLAPAGNLHDEGKIQYENPGLFRVASNALFFMEKKLLLGPINIHYHLLLFLGKLLQEQGIQPQRGSCALCDENLNLVISFILSPEHGGFICSLCLNIEEIQGHSLEGFAGLLLNSLNEIAKEKYATLVLVEKEIPTRLNQALFHYFCFQYQLKTQDFKSFGMVF